MKKSLAIKISGLVQGVGFRYACLRKAQELDVCGWVRNDPDGSVSMVAEGNSEDVEEFVNWCRRGSYSASVERVEAKKIPESNFKDFSARA
ncbi:MAG: acylphosphatase [Patescibacteria group bacterium]|nr:acylphosphatase [Patescibacteria group bacterium]